MDPLRIFIITLIAAICMACAGQNPPPQQRQPQDLHRSIRQLNKGTMFFNKGCYEKAADHFQKAHEMFTVADNIKGTADALNSLANAYFRLNDIESAVLVYGDAVGYYRLTEDRTGEVRTLTNMASALAASGMYKQADTVLSQADTLAKRQDILTALRLKSRAILKLKTQDIQSAKDLLSEAIKIIPPEERALYASAQYSMGYLLLTAQQPQEAVDYLNRALEADRKAEAYFGIAQDLESLGDCHMALEQYDLALSYFKRSIKIFTLLNSDEKIREISSKLMDSASHTDADIRATLHWVKQWSANRWEISICR